MKTSTLLYLFLLVSTTCLSQTRQDTIALIDKAMSIYLPEQPGAQLSIKKNGKIIYSKAFGSANLEYNVPLTITSKIEAGSVSKQFTAAAILLLEQQGKLSLSDDVRKYIPEMPNYGNAITLEQMMRHTSGLKDWGAIAALTGWGRSTINYSNDDALRFIIAQKTLNNIPGAEFIYSNSNYNLFAIIVERVSGQSLAAYTKQYIFIPAGMTNTEWRDNHNRIVKDRATAYGKTENGLETHMPSEDAYGNGGLLTTTEDLLKWNDFYLSGKFGTPSLFAKQTQTTTFNNGKRNDYAAGLFIQNFRGQRHIQHSGATAGYRAFLEILPDMNLEMAFLSNTSQFDGAKTRLDSTLKNIFIAETETPKPDTKETAVTVPETLLNTYAGWYKNDRSGAGMQLEVKDKNLSMNTTALVPQSDNTFKNGQAMIEIDNKKGVLRLINKTDTIPFTKVATAVVNKDYLEAFVGNYFSTETNSTITISQKDGKLVLQIKSNMAFDLNPTYKDAFTIADFGDNLSFTKNKKQQTTGMTISSGRARNVVFMKILL